MKYPSEIIKKAKQLRLAGKSYNEMAKELNISRVTLIRWSNRGYLKGVSNVTNKSNEETVNTKENLANQSSESSNIGKGGTDGNINIGGTEGLKELKELKNICDTEKLDNNSFHDMKVSYNPDGGISIFQDTNINVPEPTKPYVPEPLKDQKPEPLIEQKLDAIKTKTKDIDLLGFLLPAVCLGAGLLLDGKKGMKGEFREENSGGNW